MTTATVNIAALTRRISRVVAAELAHFAMMQSSQDLDVEFELQRAHKSLADYLMEKRTS